jgi:hypothetical protein
VPEDHVDPIREEVVDRLLGAIGGTVVHDPENATCRLVGLSIHAFTNEAIDRRNVTFFSQRPNTWA